MSNRDRINPTGTLLSCYNCNHLWIKPHFRYGDNTKCPQCKNGSFESISHYLDPNLYPTKIQVVTFGKNLLLGKRPNFYTVKDVEAYPKDRVLLALEGAGYTIVKSASHIEYNDTKGNIVLFKTRPDRATTEVYILQYDENSALPQLLTEKNKEEKAYRKTLPQPTPKKPPHTSIKDALGNDVHVGDWVAYWATKSLGFGRVEDIGEITYRMTRWQPKKVSAVRVRRGKTGLLTPFKVTDQIYLLPEATAMILMLEQ